MLLTDFQLFDHSVNPATDTDDATGPTFRLPDDINRLRDIYLPAGQDFVSFSFSAPEFRPNHQPRYAYRMAGIQDEWTDTEGRNYLSFPKLPPGDYRLELRTGDEREQWSEEIRTLGIHLAAPWYRRWWALSLFAASGLGVAGLLLRERERQRRRIAEARLAEREEFRRRTARDFHDEAGNHLSRVSLLTTVARRRLGGDEEPGAGTQVRSFLDDIDANIQVLREGMRDFIWALDPGNDTAYDLALRLKRFGQELFEHHAAEFTSPPLNPALERLDLRADQRRQLLLIGKEAMHNSFKHASRARSVCLALTVPRPGVLHFRWSDDGEGFAPGTSGDGQGVRNMRGRATKIDGAFRLSGPPGCTVEVTLRLA